MDAWMDGVEERAGLHEWMVVSNLGGPKGWLWALRGLSCCMAIRSHVPRLRVINPSASTGSVSLRSLRGCAARAPIGYGPV